jgi:hypothetical protein
MLGGLVLAVSVCLMRLPNVQASMPGMAVPTMALAALGDVEGVSPIAEPGLPPECCQIQPIVLAAKVSIAMLVVLAAVVRPTARPLPSPRSNRAVPNNFRPPGLHGRAALFAWLT